MSDSQDGAQARPSTEVDLPEHPDASPHVVLVDDDDDILDVLNIIFAEAGYRTTKCPTRQIAMAALQAESADLLVTDLRLGSEDGMELVRFAAALPGGPPKIILLTAARMPAIGASMPMLRSIGVQIVNKPFDIDQLIEVARRLIG